MNNRKEKMNMKPRTKIILTTILVLLCIALPIIFKAVSDNKKQEVILTKEEKINGVDNTETPPDADLPPNDNVTDD